MEKQHSPSAQEKKFSHANAPAMQATASKPTANTTPQETCATQTKVNETDTKIKPEDKKHEEKKPKIKKTEAVVNGNGVGISTKHSMAICDMIRDKKLAHALDWLQQVLEFKRAVKMKGEIPHRHGNLMAGRYPINASKEFIKLLRQLGANAEVNEIDIDKARIFCFANRASRPRRRGGSEKFKRTNIVLKLRIKENKTSKEKK